VHILKCVNLAEERERASTLGKGEGDSAKGRNRASTLGRKKERASTPRRKSERASMPERERKGDLVELQC
jgi:hypothetical protein